MRSPLGDGEFPGLAAFSLCGLMLVIGAIALAGLRPWATTSKAPQVSVAPGVEGALGDAVALGRDRTGDAAGVGLEAAVPATLVAESAPAPNGYGAHVAVAQLQPVAVQSPPPPPAPQSEPAVPPGAPQVPAGEPPSPSPVAEPGPGPHGPIAAGALGEPDEICEGDEFEALIRVDPAPIPGATGVEIVIRPVEGGDEDEVLLEGELSDLLDLLDSLIVEGDCVRVEVESNGVSPAEGAPEVPVLPDLEEALVPVLP